MRRAIQNWQSANACQLPDQKAAQVSRTCMLLERLTAHTLSHVASTTHVMGNIIVFQARLKRRLSRQRGPLLASFCGASEATVPCFSATDCCHRLLQQP